MLNIDQLSIKREGSPLFAPLSFSIEEHGCLGLFGPSGCGKSTLLDAIAGLKTPDAGSIIFNGKHYFSGQYNTPPWDRSIGYVMQDNQLWPGLSVIEQIWRPHLIVKRKSNKKFGKKQAIQTAMEMLAMLGLEAHHKKLPAELSGGQARRIAIARALSVEPQILLLDEPFNGLDAITRKHVKQIIAEHSQKVTIIVSHIQNDLTECQQIIQLR